MNVDNKTVVKENIRFALFGHGFHLCYLLKTLIENGFPAPVIITHPKERHERDRGLLDDPKLYEYVFDVAEQYNIPVLQSEKVNSPGVLEYLIEQKCTVGFSLSCRSIIKNEVIDFFNGKLFNIHPTILPKERGGGTFSWRILNNINEVSATLHYIDTGIDSGNIVLQKKKNLSLDYPKPYDYMVETNVLYRELIDAFLDDLQNILAANGTVQNESDSSYFPRLITETNGALDWSIAGKYIERTIRAFSRPYPGAFTYINNTKVSIMESFFEEQNHDMHPLMYGKVIKLCQDGFAKVVVKDGFINITKLKIAKGNICKPAQVISHPGQFYTPSEQVHTAKYTTNKISQVKNDL